MSRTAVLVLLVGFVLAGCAESRDDSAWQEECLAAGHTPGSAAFADCLSERQAAFEEECLSAVAACQ